MRVIWQRTIIALAPYLASLAHFKRQNKWHPINHGALNTWESMAGPATAIDTTLWCHGVARVTLLAATSCRIAKAASARVHCTTTRQYGD